MARLNGPVTWAPSRPARRRALGQDEAPGDVRPYDFSRPYTDRGSEWNRGCPPDYFAQFVGEGESGALSYAPGKAVRCRLMATTSAASIQEESGITWSESLDIYTGAVEDTARQLGGAVAGAFGWTPWLLGGAVLLVGGLLALRLVPRSTSR